MAKSSIIVQSRMKYSSTLREENFTNIASAGHRQIWRLWRAFLLQQNSNTGPSSLENSLGFLRRWGRRCSRCLKWQTAGRRWHAFLAKYSTPRSNSADRENIDTVIQGPPLWSEMLRGEKTLPASRHRHACIQWSRICFYRGKMKQLQIWGFSFDVFRDFQDGRAHETS